jgi:hypothetical protein
VARKRTNVLKTMHPVTLIPVLAILTILIFVLVPVAAEPTVTVSSYEVTPQVLMPGDLGTITVMLTNTASSASISENAGPQTSGFESSKTTDISVFIEKAGLEGNGIEVIGDNYQRIGDLGPGQTIPITFLIRAPSATGLYFPEVWVDTKGGRSTRYPIPVNVNTQIAVAKLAVLGTTVTTPDAVKPGDAVAVRLDLINSGESAAEQIIVRIGNASTSVSPKDTELYHIDSIPAGSSERLDIVLITDRKAATGIATVPVTVEYYTINGVKHTEPAAINLLIQGKTEIGIASIETSPERVVAGEPFNLIIRVENAGTGDAKSVSARIDLPFSGTREAFLGKIKPGNDAPALFRLGGAPEGDHPYIVTITYTEDWGENTVTQPLTLPVAPADYSGLVIGVIILALLAFGAWWLFIRKSPDKNHE